ncbi:hypothetical protein BD324DRAFT_614482 [Kockovaella imperatae]|uniref:N-acetyltransferase domain-containing protein n=1 Tax=Kockovaella imperatae TaxID=4999 RepID=A0A1Y1UNL6_9TREE|nr:hypothetical protein BD324DRAFT_614482 [Kockovaella imperatae]ORX39648.1 hypothetical protein BD324DRAFT_614482 [Kockovaella imperatae]
MWLRRLEWATDEQLDRISEIWSTSLRDAWIVQANHGFDQTIVSRAFRYRAQVGVTDACVWVAGEKEGEIQGAMHVFPKGCDIWVSKTAKSAWPTWQDAMDPQVYAWKLREVSPRLDDLYDRACRKYNTTLKESIFLSVIGVDTKAQRRGIGEALMSVLKKEAVKLNTIICLACGEEDTVRWYEKAGFEDVLSDAMDIRGRQGRVHVMLWRASMEGRSTNPRHCSEWSSW